MVENDDFTGFTTDALAELAEQTAEHNKRFGKRHSAALSCLVGTGQTVRLMCDIDKKNKFLWYIDGDRVSVKDAAELLRNGYVLTIH